MTVTVYITILDVSEHCGSRSNINLAEFIWKYICVFVVKMYAIVCVPLNTLKVLFLHNHRAGSDGWISDILCDEFSEEFRHVLHRFVDDCTYGSVCKCNVCLRQPPSLRCLASPTVCHFTFNLSQFTMPGRILYHQYLYAVESSIVAQDRLVPLTFSP